MLWSGNSRLDQYNESPECHLLWPHFHAWWTEGVSYPPYWVSIEHFGILVCSNRVSMGSHNKWQHRWLVHPWRIPGNHWRGSQCRIYQTIKRKRNDFQVLSCLRGNQVLTWGHPEAHNLNFIWMHPRLIYAHLVDPIEYLSSKVR